MSKHELRMFTRQLVLLLHCAVLVSCASGEDVQLPVREITVFKDGHALVTHEGELVTDDNGNATIDYVPVPVIGTFWAHSAQENATLRSVSSGNRKITKTRSAKQTRELLQANVGAKVSLRDHNNGIFTATIVSAEPDAAVVLLKTDLGTKVVPADSIQEVTFLEDPKLDMSYEESRNQLRLQLDWGNHKPAKTARIGMSYLQRGIRWIPNYRLHLKENGTVLVQMQATLALQTGTRMTKTQAGNRSVFMMGRLFSFLSPVFLTPRSKVMVLAYLRPPAPVAAMLKV